MKKILVIEDELSVGSNILEILESGGFAGLLATNGKMGVQLAKEQVPDLIVCDIMMPDMDGYAVLEALRAQLETAAIPFIFLTAKTTRDDVRHGMNLGADDYITKPFRRTELLDAIAVRLAKATALKQLQHQVQELQQTNIEKDELILTVSHDLRAPLANIKLIAETLKITPNLDQQEQYLSILELVCEQGNDLINNLLVWRQLQEEKYTFSFETFSLQYWLPGMLEPFEVRTGDREQLFQVNIPSDLPFITTDPISLKRILTELLNNACKYTFPGGKIAFQVLYQPDKSATATSSIIFIIGNEAEIPASDLPRIFEKFYRISQGDYHHQSGTGLGLTIVEKLVEQLEGTIQVESHEGWTTFTVYLPVKPASNG
jgi:two-component system, sensor histidine kinase and response regulator